jgi:hypothetical protein
LNGVLIEAARVSILQLPKVVAGGRHLGEHAVERRPELGGAGHRAERALAGRKTLIEGQAR